jgi:PhnB protein
MSICGIAERQSNGRTIPQIMWRWRRHQIANSNPKLRGGDIMQVQPYLFFNGRCEEAVEFYRSALGAQVEMLVRFKESPEPQPADMVPPGSENKIMHTSFRIGDTTLMASDGRCDGQSNFQGFSLSLTPANEAEADRIFAALAKGGQVQMPLTKTFWSPRFGMVADRFGVTWMVNVAP